ncbi:Hsp20/alpha crystallin family protein [Oesophagostomum dentatum]|uniref:Hsp20/alpha crystallin family protein n=1 Tax=Oesophagostomum dentatum TaxID=61180 RepID=A0A0B1TJB2_OESDE|nr:Hsp20/alpha crystallin family protein [Oesophagostomum dentatum]
MSVEVQHSSKYWDWPLQHNDEAVTVTDTATDFKVDLDAKPFGPKEIQVKTIGDLIEIQMDHERRGNDIMNVSRSITRCYKLPQNVDMKTLKSNLDDNGVLHISAKKK